jgi:hypothetical protein
MNRSAAANASSRMARPFAASLSLTLSGGATWTRLPRIQRQQPLAEARLGQGGHWHVCLAGRAHRHERLVALSVAYQLDRPESADPTNVPYGRASHVARPLHRPWMKNQLVEIHDAFRLDDHRRQPIERVWRGPRRRAVVREGRATRPPTRRVGTRWLGYPAPPPRDRDWRWGLVRGARRERLHHSLSRAREGRPRVPTPVEALDRPGPGAAAPCHSVRVPRTTTVLSRCLTSATVLKGRTRLRLARRRRLRTMISSG